MDCANCGAPLGEGSEACDACGLPVSGSAAAGAAGATVASAGADPDATAVYPSSTGGGGASTDSPGGPPPIWKRPWFWVVVAVVVLAVLAVIAVMVSDGSDESTSTTGTSTAGTSTTAPPTTTPPTTAPPTTAPPTTEAPATTTTAAAATTTTVTNQVSIINLAFDPQSITVKVGDTVTWVNGDSTAHTVVADDGSFDSGDLAPGASFAFTFSAAGTVPYHCGVHPQMTGGVVVQ